MKTFTLCYLFAALTAAAIVQWHDAARQPLPVGTPEPPVLVCPCGGGCAPDCDCGCRAGE